MVGQTVMFAVVKTPGITITDRRLIDSADRRVPAHLRASR